MPAKNLLMFSVDDLRTLDNWGHFGALVHAPNLDRLAGEGTSFERTVAQVPLCNPSRASVFTGQLPSQTGVLDNDVIWYERVDVANTLPAVLRQAGAYVAMFGKNLHSDPIDLDRQKVMFDEFLFPETDGAASQVIHDDVFHTTPFASGRYGGSPDNLRDEQTVAAALDFLEHRAGDLDKPFFLGVGFFRPHLDWWVPSKYYDLYDQADIRAALDAESRRRDDHSGQWRVFRRAADERAFGGACGDRRRQGSLGRLYPRLSRLGQLRGRQDRAGARRARGEPGARGRHLDPALERPRLPPRRPRPLAEVHALARGDAGADDHRRSGRARRAGGAAGGRARGHLPDRPGSDGHQDAGAARSLRQQSAADRQGHRHRLVRSRRRQGTGADDDLRLGLDPRRGTGRRRPALQPLPGRKP